ncbi:M48 family metallopeptidase [Muricoccus aerilatus]|uniref:M48 family metallopeptidase n=1 Tax=Muricoccus aerilatus TaxID=452982 RepID=UPI0005C15700|nr:M48 family metallopeptidase [Roseomonas aerilata]
MERSVLLALLALPVLFSGLGAWEVWRAAATPAEYQALADQHWERTAVLRDLEQHDAGARVKLPGSSALVPVRAAIARSEQARDAAEADGSVARAREVAAWLTLVAGVATGTIGLAGLLLVRRSARRGMQSRSELVAAFGRVSRLLPAALGAQVVGAVLALSGAVAFEVGGLWFVSNPDDRTVLLAILVLIWAGLALWGGIRTLRNLRRALRAFQPAPLPVSAVPITETQAPSLFALLHDLAWEQGSTPPETVTAGAEDGFFVTALPVLLHGAPDAAPIATRGRVLHLPLPLVAALDITELRTVLAHELAHFSGEDTDYGLRFAPLFAGLGQGAAAMSLRGGDYWGTTLVDRVFERAVHPHTALAVHAFEQFSHVVAHWSRLRELEADRAGAASGSPVALASSLLRVGLASELLKAARIGLSERPDDAPRDLAAALVACLREGTGDPAAHLGDEAPHPTDSHPPTWQRIEAAGVVVDGALLARAARPVDAADLVAVQALFLDWETLSGTITGHLRDRALRGQEAHPARLREAAVATEGLGETALHASLLRPVLALALFGAFCLAVSAGCVLAALYGGKQDREAWRFLFGVAAVGAVGLGFLALWSVRLWRGWGRPYLVLDEEGVRSPGFTGTVRWLDVSAIGVSSVQSPTTWFVLRPEALLPRSTGLMWRLRIDEEQRAVQFMAVLPRGLDEAAFRALLLRYAGAAHAQQALDADLPIPVPPSAG